MCLPPCLKTRAVRRRSSPRAQIVLGGKLRDVKRPACLHRQTGACRSCGQAVCQPCRRHVKPVGAQRTPTDWQRTRRKVRSGPRCPTDEAINPNRQTSAQRKKRSTPTVRRVPSGRSDQPQPLNGARREKGLSLQPPNVPGGRRAYHSTSPDEADDEGLITPSIRPMLPAKGFVTPHRQHPSWATFSVQPGLREQPPGF